MSTIEDVARLAGVSRGSVSNVLSGKVRMGDAMRARVLAAAATLGYRPNRLASALASGHYATVALLVPDITNWVMANLVTAVETAASARHYPVTICHTNKEVARERAHLEALYDSRVAGLIAIAEGVEAAVYCRLQAAGTRIVLVNNRVVGLDAPLVRFDLRQAFTTALARLAELDAGPIGVLVPESAPVEGQRPASAVSTGRLGVRRLIEECAAGLGLTVTIESRQTSSVADARAAMAALLAAERPPSAIFAASWPHTLGMLAVVNALSAAERRRLALIGTGIGEYVEAVAPWLTYIDLPAGEQGRLAAERLFAALDGASDLSTVETVIPLRLVERQSTAGRASRSRRR